MEGLVYLTIFMNLTELDKEEFYLQNCILCTLMIFLIMYLCQIGCHIDNLCVNLVMHADDICLIELSPGALQKLIHIFFDFNMQNNSLFNSFKSFCMLFKPRLYKLSCLSLYMSIEKLEYTNITKYLGFAFGSDKKDDNDMLRGYSSRNIPNFKKYIRR